MSLREAILQVAPWNKGGLQVTLAARNGDSLAAPRTECWEKLGNGSWRFADCDQGKPIPASDDIHWVPLDQAAKFRIVELDDNPESGAKRCVNRCD